MKNHSAAELILNPDGSIYHLHLHPGDIAEDIILVGDPERVDMISSKFEKVEIIKKHREFRTHTGFYQGKRISVISTGIGTDNIDIVLNELDALVNINLNSGEPYKKITGLNFFRIGTTGGMQGDIPLNSFIVSRIAIGFDGVLNFYHNRDLVCDLRAEKEFKSFVSWNRLLPSPYFISSSENLFERLNDNIISGMTISAPGFYGPQGRSLRLKSLDPLLNKKINSFRYNEMRITNYEMESSALFGLSSLLGHEAITICAMIANRITGEITTDYKPVMDKLITFTLNHIC
ncbi:MAG: phosphorylase [Bacteroides sp. SM23_62_1]|nr:MAG: phosphorylase [Bacteroides sp. SM23_62_1]